MNIIRFGVRSAAKAVLTRESVQAPAFLSSLKCPTNTFYRPEMQQSFVLPAAAQMRCQHTISNMSTLEKMKWDLGLYGTLRCSKNHLFTSGFKLYVCCTDLIDFPHFIKELGIPDTFTSWFLVLHIHMWLLQVKLNSMGKEGLLLNQTVYKNMWADVERRLNTFKELLGSEKNSAIRNYHSVMCSSILHYDEGLIGSDSQLANALWVQFFSMADKTEAKQLELMVEYVRKQAYHLDQQDEEMIMKSGYVSFLPLYGDSLPADKWEKDQKIVNLTAPASK